MLKRRPFESRIEVSASPFAKELLQIMLEKESNLAVSADVTSVSELLKLADVVGRDICLFKTHIDIIRDFTWDAIQALQAIAEKHRFLLFEDRKFADIGQTVFAQYSGGIYRISEWAHLVNGHALPGPLMVKTLASVGEPLGRGMLLIAEMSSRGHLLGSAYAKETFEIARAYPSFVAGFITQHGDLAHPEWLYMAPGIHAEVKGDNRGQQYATPEDAIQARAIDVIIVGRGIIAAESRSEASAFYRKRAWRAYLETLE